MKTIAASLGLLALIFVTTPAWAEEEEASPPSLPVCGEDQTENCVLIE